VTIEYKYNKVALQELRQQLKIRETALPTLKNKESALRMEVKKAKEKAARIEADYQTKLEEIGGMMRLWGEFEDDLLQLRQVRYAVKNIAGVKTPVLKELEFEVKPFSLFQRSSWFPDGIEILKALTRMLIEKEVAERTVSMLEYARKKTTQKVNLYEKVQIPAYEEAIRKIKRFLEDEENLGKAAQKILKRRKEMQEAS